LFKKLKDFPKIHDLDELLTALNKVYSRKEIEGFRKENVAIISALNQAYISPLFANRIYRGSS
jgi:HEPN domain-containing protein